MFEMTMVLLASIALMSIAYELTFVVKGGDWGENSKSFF